jgi:hypothetical protein
VDLGSIKCKSQFFAGKDDEVDIAKMITEIVSKSSSIPWELIQLNTDLSGSEEIYSDKYRNMFEHYVETTENCSVSIPESYDEFKEMLEICGNL